MDTIVVAPPRPASRPAHRRSRWWAVPGHLVAGLLLGAVARGWMRLISDEPDFTWAGTIGILGVFAGAGIGQGVARAVVAGRRRARSSVARLAGAVLSLGLFGAAGSVMFPCVVCASLAAWRHDWWRWARVVAALASLAVPIALWVEAVDQGLTLRRSGGLVLLATTYAALVWSLGPVVRPLGDGWRMWRPIRWLLVPVAGAVIAGSVALSLAAGSFL